MHLICGTFVTNMKDIGEIISFKIFFQVFRDLFKIFIALQGVFPRRDIFRFSSFSIFSQDVFKVS